MAVVERESEYTYAVVKITHFVGSCKYICTKRRMLNRKMIPMCSEDLGEDETNNYASHPPHPVQPPDHMPYCFG